MPPSAVSRPRGAPMRDSPVRHVVVSAPRDLPPPRKLKVTLSREEVTEAHTAFMSFDRDRSGCIDVFELRQVLESLGQTPSDDELFQMIAEVDDDLSGTIEFNEFLSVMLRRKERLASVDNEADLVDAFIACGGNADLTGHVERSTLVNIIKGDFGLTIDIDELINAVDTDGSGAIEYGEFKELLLPQSDSVQRRADPGDTSRRSDNVR